MAGKQSSPLPKEEILFRVLEAPREDRRRVLEELCGSDRSLLRELSEIVDREPFASEFFEMCTKEGSLEPDVLPRTIGPYAILKRLGTGGMGTVYLAEEANGSPGGEKIVPRQLALKVIKPGLDTKEVLRRFELERRVLARLNHKGIAKVFEAEETNHGAPYFAMEYVDGELIREYCKSHELDWKAIAALFTQVCEAVEHAHSHEILHRDIKPSNILVTETEDVPCAKVIDFGIAKALDGDLPNATRASQLDRFIGTLCYASPEQLRGSRDLDKRTDVFSLGATLFELLAAKSPFTEDERRRHALSYEPSDPPLLRREKKSLPVALETVLEAAMAIDRDDRYPSAGALADDLQNVLEGRRPGAPRAHIRKRAARWIRRHRRIASATAFGLLLALAITLPIVVHLRSRSEVRPETVAALDRGLARLRYTRDMISASRAADLDADERARDLLLEHRSPESPVGLDFAWWHLARRVELDRPILRLDGAPLGKIIVSHDGRWLYGLGNAAGEEDTLLAAWSKTEDGLLYRDWQRRLGFPYSGAALDTNDRTFEVGIAGTDAVATVDASNGRVTRRWKTEGRSPAIEISSDGSLCLVSHSRLWVLIYLRPENRLVARCRAHEEKVGWSTSKLTREGKRIITVGHRMCRLWRVPNRDELARLTEPLHELEKLVEIETSSPFTTVSTYGDMLATVHLDGMMVLRDVDTFAVREEVSTGREPVKNLAFSQDGTLLATGTERGQIAVWSRSPLERIANYDAAAQRVLELQFVGDSGLLASIEGDGTGRFRNVNEPRPPFVDVHTERLLWNVVFRDDGTLITEDDTPEFTVWNQRGARDTGTLRAIGSIRGAAWPLRQAKRDVSLIAPSGNILANSTHDCRVKLHRAPSAEWNGEAVVDLGRVAVYAVYGLGFSRDSELLAASSAFFSYPGCENHVRVWKRRENGTALGAWDPVLDFMSDVASREIILVSEKRLLIQGGRQDSPIELRDLSTGDRIATFAAQGFVVGFALSPDSRYLATLGQDGSVEFWRLPHAEEKTAPVRVLELSAHANRVQALCFFPSGREFVTGPKDGPIKHWRLFEDGGKLEVLESIELDNPQGEVKALSVSSDGRTLAAAGELPGDAGGWLRVWYAVEDGELVENR